MTEITSGIGDLLERLRKDGVQGGEQERRRILREAEDAAKELIAGAEARAEAILADARAEAEAKRAQLDAELAMAARDFVLAFAQRVRQQVIQPLVRERAGESLQDADTLRALLSVLLSERAGGGCATVAPEQQSQVATFFERQLAEKMAGEPLEVRSEDGLNGFRLQRQGEGFTWEVTDESVSRELSALVEPALRRYLAIGPERT